TGGSNHIKNACSTYRQKQAVPERQVGVCGFVPERVKEKPTKDQTDACGDEKMCWMIRYRNDSIERPCKKFPGILWPTRRRSLLENEPSDEKAGGGKSEK